LNFKLKIRKLINTKLKFWLDDIFTGGKDEYSQNSIILTDYSKFLRSKYTVFLVFVIYIKFFKKNKLKRIKTKLIADSKKMYKNLKKTSIVIILQVVVTLNKHYILFYIQIVLLLNSK